MLVVGCWALTKALCLGNLPLSHAMTGRWRGGSRTSSCRCQRSHPIARCRAGGGSEPQKVRKTGKKCRFARKPSLWSILDNPHFASFPIIVRIQKHILSRTPYRFFSIETSPKNAAQCSRICRCQKRCFTKSRLGLGEGIASGKLTEVGKPITNVDLGTPWVFMGFPHLW